MLELQGTSGEGCNGNKIACRGDSSRIDSLRSLHGLSW